MDLTPETLPNNPCLELRLSWCLGPGPGVPNSLTDKDDSHPSSPLVAKDKEQLLEPVEKLRSPTRKRAGVHREKGGRKGGEVTTEVGGSTTSGSKIDLLRVEREGMARVTAEVLREDSKWVRLHLYVLT